MTAFSSVVTNVDERFGKDILRAAHHSEINFMTQGSVFQEQVIMRFAMGCNDPSVSSHFWTGHQGQLTKR